jgi:hypothetical protein
MMSFVPYVDLPEGCPIYPSTVILFAEDERDEPRGALASIFGPRPIVTAEWNGEVFSKDHDFGDILVQRNDSGSESDSGASSPAAHSTTSADTALISHVSSIVTSSAPSSNPVSAASSVKEK